MGAVVSSGLLLATPKLGRLYLWINKKRQIVKSQFTVSLIPI
jgi:hypothetical protein